MMRIRVSDEFVRDMMREMGGCYAEALRGELAGIVSLIADGEDLPPRYRCEVLRGWGGGFRECSIRPGLVMIWCVTGRGDLYLARLGARAEIF